VETSFIAMLKLWRVRYERTVRVLRTSDLMQIPAAQNGYFSGDFSPKVTILRRRYFVCKRE
jgi:hypothetical protein